MKTILPMKPRRPSIAVVHTDGFVEETISARTVWLLFLGLAVVALLGGCGSTRNLPMLYMPDPPKECKQISEFKVEPFPKGKTTDAQVSVWLAKEGAQRQKEHEIAKVCADYALGTADVMADAKKPEDKKATELAERARQPSKNRTDAESGVPQPLTN